MNSEVPFSCGNSTYGQHGCLDHRRRQIGVGCQSKCLSKLRKKPWCLPGMNDQEALAYFYLDKVGASFRESFGNSDNSNGSGEEKSCVPSSERSKSSSDKD